MSGSPLLRRVHSFLSHMKFELRQGLLVGGVQSALKSTDSVYTVGNSQQIRGWTYTWGGGLVRLLDHTVELLLF